MSKFKIELSSVPDRENLVAEIWYEKKMVAEVNKETEKFVIEFYLDEKKLLLSGKPFPHIKVKG